jgi:hypothetical protein
MGHVNELIMASLLKHYEITWGVRTKEKEEAKFEFYKTKKITCLTQNS